MLANAPGYGLSSSIYTTDPDEVFAFRRGISAGMVSVNNSTSGAEAHLPFGGNGKSGNGSRQSGMWVLDQFTRWQAVNWDYSGRLQKAQMDVVELDAGHAVPAAGVSNALDEALRSAVAGSAAGQALRHHRGLDRSAPGSALSVGAALDLFDAQATSRHLDFAARGLAG